MTTLRTRPGTWRPQDSDKRTGKIIAIALLVVGACVAWPRAGRADPIQIMPHRAIYDMSLSKDSQNGQVNSQVASANGKMMFEWAEDCNGWTVNQKLNMTFYYAEGNAVQVKTSMSSWESLDGKSYSFDVDRNSNDKPEERFRGTASLSDSGGVAHYEVPDTIKDMQLAPGTLFPTAHTILLIEQAKAGEHTLTRSVFDGSDDQGKSDVSAFIGTGSQLDGVAGINSPLTHGMMWPIRLAFYPPDKSADQPDYEMGMNLLENGVAESMLIDYGDFALKAKLSHIEALPVPKCDE